MSLDFVITYVIQAWGSPQVEGMKIRKGKVLILSWSKSKSKPLSHQTPKSNKSPPPKKEGFGT